MRVQGGRIVLPINVRREIHNERIEKIDNEIVHSRNRLGFRGADPPTDFGDHLTIVAVGGSTTECYYLSDGRTWPEQIGPQLDGHFTNSWINNAGLDGQSTYGHSSLLDQYLIELQPDVILFLIGLNDVGLRQPASFDTAMNPGSQKQAGVATRFWRTIVEYSAVASLIDNARRSAAAHEAGVVHENISHEQLLLDAQSSVTISESTIDQLTARHHSQFLPDYRRRVEHLIQRSRQHGIHPVLITQPALPGEAIDPTTGVDLGALRVDNLNGRVRWKILELYNNVVRDVGKKHHIDVIDLAHLMPKDSQYYYDHYHFTNKGAELVGDLVSNQLIPILKEKFPEHCQPGL